MRHPGRAPLFLLIILLTLTPLAFVRAQDASVYPLPADLYILTSEQRVLRIDATTGEQTAVSPEGQPVGAFDIAPDGGWYAYRTLDNHAVIVAALNTMSGFVVEFDQPMPAGVNGRGISWSPDGSRIAYTVPDGVRVVELAAFGMGDMPTMTIEGGPWAYTVWADNDTLVAIDGAGTGAQIQADADTWRVDSGPAAPTPTPPVEAAITTEGVRLADGRIVPGTAGTLAFHWGSLPLPELPAGTLPADLYFLVADDSDDAQVWQLPASGEPARAVTSSDQTILDYSVAVGRVAYVTPGDLFVAPLEGGEAQPLGTLITGRVRPTVAFNGEGSHIAFSDERGLWVVLADASEPPRLVVQNVLNDDPSTIRVYSQPRWNSGDTQLLVTVGLYEGAYLGVVDLASGAVTELPTSLASLGQWTDDGRVATSSASLGYSTPGLYLVDPTAAEAEPITLLGSDTPVFDIAQAANGTWLAVVGSSAGMGPQRMRLLTGSESDPFTPAFGADVGAFIEEPALAPTTETDAAPALVAGLRNVTFGEDGIWGELTVADLSSGERWAVPAPGMVSQVTWAP